MYSESLFNVFSGQIFLLQFWKLLSKNTNNLSDSEFEAFNNREFHFNRASSRINIIKN